MPMRYIFSSFWEGQEGSFLLWIFWHVILGNLLIFFEKKLESSVLMVFGTVQLFLTSMVLGVYLGDVNIGSNPFAFLLREHPDFMKMPIFQNEHYLTLLDGRGLNPLLQNYWMTIHPPTLFLGFSAVTVPFSYAMSSLISGDTHSWLKGAIPWTFFGVMVLGGGLLMGGAWAYEALSFGGFWAWDPVENASLVPWLTLVAAGHIMLVAKNRNTSFRIAYLFTFLSFVFVIYSTFLTRSGILGETSVHAFVDLGLNGQLLAFLLFYIIVPIFLLIRGFIRLPKEQEGVFWSREFWMFLGSFFLVITAFFIIQQTSLPVFNKLFGWKKAPKSDIIAQYHLFVVPITCIIAIFIGVTQLMKYKKTTKKIWSTLVFPMLTSIILTFGIVWMIYRQNGWFGVGISFKESDLDFLKRLIPITKEINVFFFVLLLMSTIFALLINIEYFFKIVSNSIKKAGSAMAHAGFMLLLIGTLISMSQQEVISYNTSGIDVRVLGDELRNQDNILMYKGDTLKMGKYYISYQGMRKEGVNIYYQVDYFQKNDLGKLEKDFSLYPTVQTNPRMGNVSEPDTRHFLHKDIYTHVTYALLEELKVGDKDAYAEKPKVHTLHERDTFFTSNAMVVLESINKAMNVEELGLSEKSIAVGAFLSVRNMHGKKYEAKPIYVLSEEGRVHTIPSEVEELGLLFTFDKINPQTLDFDVNVYEKNKNFKEFIVMKAISFPGINVLWAGCFIMCLGIVISIINRISTSSKQK